MLLVVAAVLVHALIQMPRYELRGTAGNIFWARVDRWTGVVEPMVVDQHGMQSMLEGRLRLDEVAQ